MSKAESLLADFVSEFVIANRGYPSATLEARMELRGSIPMIPPHSHCQTSQWYDCALYKEHHVIKCFLNKLKHNHRVFPLFDELA